MDDKNDDSLPSGENADAETLDTVLHDEEGDLDHDENMDIDAIESAGTDTNADIQEAADADLAEECADAAESENPEEAADQEQLVDADASLDTTPPSAEAIPEALTEELGEHSSSTDTAVTDSISAPAPTADESMSSDALAAALTENYEEKEPEADEQIADAFSSTEMKSSSAVYSLEEELQRMHEGDPSEELQNQPSTDLLNEKQSDSEELMKTVEKVTKPVVKIAEQVRTSERTVKPAEKTYRGAKSFEKKVTTVPKVPDSPIMKDSDLEEILGADEILRDPVLIKDAQEQMKVTDVLVCGRCYESFIFVEEFQKHKLKLCKCRSGWSCEGETKPHIWGFTLWRSRQLKTLRPNVPKHADWKIYQSWCNLSETDRNAWVAAGQTLQSCTKIGTGKLTEVRQILQSTKTPIKEEKDPLALDGFESNKENTTITVGRKPIIEMKKPLIKSVRVVKDIVPSLATSASPKVVPKADPNVNRATRTLRSTDKGERGEFAVERIVAKRFNPKKKVWEYQIKWEHFPSEDNTWEPIENLNHCKQMVDDFEQQLAKLKAEKAQQQAANLVKNRPKILNTQAAIASPSSSSVGDTPNRPQRTSKQKALNQVKAWCGSISDEENTAGGGAGTGSGAVKRARSPDSDDSFEKRMKFESDDSDSDTKSPVQKVQPYKKIAPKPAVQIIKNGLGQVGSLPPNVLIPDANGVVRINQKQLPSLSAGVYIMSKTAGIIKLDSNTSKVATSGGQTIVKVAPKIGQTQIKIVKKDGSTTRQIVQMSPQNVRLTPQKIVSPAMGKAKRQINVRPLMKKPVEAVKRTGELLKKTPETAAAKRPALGGKSDVATPVSVKKIPELLAKSAAKKEDVRRPAQLIYGESPRRADDDSDDGLEELPFPEEIKLPEPEEDDQPEDFFLDPSTGKIAGREYPEPEEEEEPAAEEAKSDLSLDNIVKLAAADITEEDLKTEPGEVEMRPPTQEEEEMMVEEEKVKAPIRMEPIRKIVTPSPTRTVVRMPIGVKRAPSSVVSSSSILNKALTGQQVIRRSVLSAPKTVVQQRVLNPSVARTGAAQVISPVVRPMGTYVRTKQVVARPKQQGGVAMAPKVVRTQHTVSPRNVYSFTKSPVQQQQPSVTRKIGNTIIRTSSSPVVQQLLQQPRTPQQRAPPQRLVQSASGGGGLVQRTFVQKKEPLVIRGQPEMIEQRKVMAAKPKKVISMPSLIGDDDLLLVPKTVALPPKEPSPQPALLLASELEPPSEEAQQHEEEAASQEVATKMEKMEEESAEQQLHDEQAAAGASGMAPDMSTFTMADNENPIFITGDDGTVYQVAGQNEQGQTILLTQGSDGQQQCLLVTNEAAESMETAPVEEPPQPVDMPMPDISPEVTEPLTVKTDVTEGGDQVVAQVVRAEPPSPGGTHKVVVMLPDGNLMVTQVSPEEYASLELE